MIKYIQDKRDDEMTLDINDMNMADWYADTAFVVHADTKSQTGGVLTMGKGSIQTISMNHKINIKSSTE